MARTIKEEFRQIYGYDNNHTCKTCKNCKLVKAGMRNAYKCIVMGVTRSAASDIRLKDPACAAYEGGKYWD